MVSRTFMTKDILVNILQDPISHLAVPLGLVVWSSRPLQDS